MNQVYWAAVLDVKCAWGMRRSAGRLPIPVITLSSTNEKMVEMFAGQMELKMYKTGVVWYTQITGAKLWEILGLYGPGLVFRRAQWKAWLLLMNHIRLHRGSRHKPLSADQRAARERLIQLAEDANPFQAN